VLCLALLFASSCEAWRCWLPAPAGRGLVRRSRLLTACAAAEQSSATAMMPSSGSDASALLDALDLWLRQQTIENVLPKHQAKALLADLRDDRRFWAQQRRQFAIVWTSIEAALRVETRPLSTVMGPDSCERFLDAVEQMDDDPALVNAVLRSEVFETVLGKILYDAIFEFVQRADFLGNVFNQLPVIGAIRMQMLTAARKQLDEVLGAQISRFLGEYTVAAVESAATYLLSAETESKRRRARRRLAEKLLAKPIAELFQVSDIEMVLVRDAVWLAVQEFRLPDEEQLVDSLYAEFGHQPFTIMLPNRSTAARGDAPLYERGQSVLHAVLERFLVSGEWSTWLAEAHGLPGKADARGSIHVTAAVTVDEPAEPSEEHSEVAEESSSAQWDGWD